LSETDEDSRLTISDLRVGDPVFWETPWSKRLAALVIELGPKRVRVALKRRKKIADYWTPIERLVRADFTTEHRRLEEEARGFFQHDLFS